MRPALNLATKSSIIVCLQTQNAAIIAILAAMDILLPKLCIVTGYYGVGKTNLSLNLATSAAARTPQLNGSSTADEASVTLIDLDIINPYFRSSDYGEILQQHGVELIAPTFARAGIEVPALPAAINGGFDALGTVIIDVGGDDAGATTLARYRIDIERRLAATRTNSSADSSSDDRADFALWYVVNRNRSTDSCLQAAAAEAVTQLREIEAACKLQATGIINNTHLQGETTLADIHEGLTFGQSVAAAAELPLIMSTIPATLCADANGDPVLQDLLSSGQLQPVELLVTTPWQ
ncbi:MAG: ParA family protein [Coriobacteriia bacterium]|nr:ParA family protein [Coriobacteriia bacterium]